jgi:two-component system chemotaxis response regulator CheB
MGSDGKEGCAKLKPLGATIWSQDEQSSTIYGMPMAVAKAGLTDRVLSLTDIAKHLAELR